MEPGDDQTVDVGPIIAEAERALERSRRTLAFAEVFMLRFPLAVMLFTLGSAAWRLYRRWNQGTDLLEWTPGLEWNRPLLLVTGGFLAFEGLLWVLFALMPRIMTRRMLQEMTNPRKFPQFREVQHILDEAFEDYRAKTERSVQLKPYLQLSYQVKGAMQMIIGLFLSFVATSYYQTVGGPWALLNLLAILPVVLWCCPTRSGMERWVLEKVALHVDTALPPDFLD